jgi:hypothetical protein
MDYNSGQYNFKKDIITGVQGEAFIRKHLESLGFKYISSNNDIFYDLKMSYKEKEYTYEIKTDVYPTDTGNLVIEFECRGNPSGINATSADYFTTYFPNFGEIWNIKTSELRKLISKMNPHVFTNSGDKGSKTKLYRLPKKEVEKFFKVHKV